MNFTEIMSKNKEQARKETEFALSALMEIPAQYKATIEHNLLGYWPVDRLALQYNRVIYIYCVYERCQLISCRRRNGSIPERIPLPPPVQSGSSFFNPTKASQIPSFEPSVPPYPIETKLGVDENQVIYYKL